VFEVFLNSARFSIRLSWFLKGQKSEMVFCSFDSTSKDDLYVSRRIRKKGQVSYVVFSISA
jgi:hypothetical protein